MRWAHADVASKTSMFPAMDDPAQWVPILLVPLAVQWWRAITPALNLAGAATSRNACSVATRARWGHAAIQCGALCPAPVAVDFDRLGVDCGVPHAGGFAGGVSQHSADKIGHDLAHPAMLSLLPEGLGLVSASLLAAFMSTMSTQLNLGASYLVNDFGCAYLTGCHRCGAGACGPIGDRVC